MNEATGLPTLDSLKPEDLIGKTIFIRVDFNVPMEPSRRHAYRVADDARIRRFLDLTFKTLHEMTGGDCRIIIGSHLGRPQKEKDHANWDGIFNIQFVSSHFDTLVRKVYGDAYTIFPPETIDEHLENSLAICADHRMPIGGIKFLPNLRYLLDPVNPDSYRQEFIEKLAQVSDVFINCAFGSSHRLSRSIKLLPQIMRKQGKLAVAGDLLNEEIKQLGTFGHKVLAKPEKTVVIAGGAKIADKIGILKEFVNAGIKAIFIGGKMVNPFLLAKSYKGKIASFSIQDLPKNFSNQDEAKSKAFIEEINLAHEILTLGNKKNVSIIFPDDYKVVKNLQDSEFEIKELPDWDKEFQLDLGSRTIENYEKNILEGTENFFWNGPLGAYDHPHCDHYAKASLKLAQALFCHAIKNANVSVVIGGGDSAAILNKFVLGELKEYIRKQIALQISPTINPSSLNIDFSHNDCYSLFNNFASNFFVSTGGGASLEFLEKFLIDQGRSSLGSYLPGAATLLENGDPIDIKSGRVSKISAV